MRRWGPGQAIGTLIGGVVLWGCVAALCLMMGSSSGFGWPGPELMEIRRESVLIASLVGAGLATAGVVYQAILRNGLADPYLLGASTGATLFAYLWQTALAGSVMSVIGVALTQQAFAFVGALVAIGVVFALASSRGRIEPITLLLVGVIVNAVNASIFLLLNAITKDRPGQGGPLALLVGGIQTTLSMQQKLTALVLIGVGFAWLWGLSGQLNAATVSEAEAESLGVRIHRLRWIGLILASLVTAAAVGISGPIGFVGLVCPHIARLVVGRDVRRLLPISAALGGALLALADAATRYLAGMGRAETMLPVGVLTGLLGGPFFLVMLYQSRRARGGEEIG